MMWAFETPLERRERVLKSACDSALLRLGVMMTVLTHNRSQQILAADDSDHLPVPHHGHALDPVGGQHTRDLAGIGVLADADDRPRHDVARDAIGGTQAGKEIGAQRFAFRQQGEPPLTPRIVFRLVAADQVALADHADCRAAIVENRDRADVVLKQKPSDVRNRRICGRRDDRARHHLTRVHEPLSSPRR
jgi:hypothetical protein